MDSIVDHKILEQGIMPLSSKATTEPNNHHG